MSDRPGRRAYESQWEYRQRMERRDAIAREVAIVFATVVATGIVLILAYFAGLYIAGLQR